MTGSTDAAGNAVNGSRAGKSQAAFRTISEVADELDVAQHVLRFWESKFPQVRPLKRGGGRRYYRPEDVELLRDIRSLLYDEGYTIKGAQKLLRQRRARAAGTAKSAEKPAQQDLAVPRTVVEGPSPHAPAAHDPALAAPALDPRQYHAPGISVDDVDATDPPLASAATSAPAIGPDDLTRLRKIRDGLSALRQELHRAMADS